MATTTTTAPPPTENTPQAPPGKKLCPHTCSCIVKYSSKERGRSALSTRGAAYWDHIKNVNIHPDCTAQCPGHPLLRGDNKEPPVKKQRMLGFGAEPDGEWGYTNMWQGPPSTSSTETREREGRDLEGLTMDTKSDINRWISGGSRPFVYTAAPDTIANSLRSYSSFIDAYANELGIVLQFQRVPQPRNNNNPLSPSPSFLSASPSVNQPNSSTSPLSISDITPAAENSLITLSTTALSTDSNNTSSTPSSPTVSTPQQQIPDSSSVIPPSPPSSPPTSHSAGSSWVFVKALEQRWDVKTWADWYSKESSKKKHKVAYYLVNIPVRAEDHSTFKKDPVTAMLSHRGTLCLNQYINIFDEYLPIPDMDAKLFLAPPWTGVVLTPPCIDRNRTQSLHRVIFGDGLNLVHIWEKLTEDQENRFRKVIGLPDTHERQLHPFQLKYGVDDSTEVWDRSKEEELQKWGILSNRIELMPGQTLIVPLDMPHVMKKLGPIPASSQVAHSSQSSFSSHHATIINHAAPPSHAHPHHPHSHSSHPHSLPHPHPHSHSALPLSSSFSPLVHGPLVTPSSHVSAIIAPPPTSPSPIVVPPNFTHHHPSSTTISLHGGSITNQSSQPSFIPFTNSSYQSQSSSNNVQPGNFTAYNTPTTSFSNSSNFPSTSSAPTYVSSNPSFPSAPFSSSQSSNPNFQSNTFNNNPPGVNYANTYAPLNAAPPNFGAPTSSFPSSYSNSIVVNYSGPTTSNNNNSTTSYSSSFNFLSQPTLPSSTVTTQLAYPTTSSYSSSSFPPKSSVYPPSNYASTFSNYTSPTKLAANSPSITPIHMNKPTSSSSSFSLSSFSNSQPKIPITNFAPSEEILLPKAPPSKDPEPTKENTNNNSNNVLDLGASFGGINTSMSGLGNINNLINNITNNENDTMEIDQTTTQAPSHHPPLTPQATDKDEPHTNPENEPFPGLDDQPSQNGHVGSHGDSLHLVTGESPMAEANPVPVSNEATQQPSTVPEQESVISQATEVSANDTSVPTPAPISNVVSQVSEVSANDTQQQIHITESSEKPVGQTIESTTQVLEPIKIDSRSSEEGSAENKPAAPSTSVSSTPATSPSSSASVSPSTSSSSISHNTNASTSSSTSNSPFVPSSSASTSTSSTFSASSASSSSSSAPFPVPLLTYSGECSFVGTTRESFARNVDLMKYWHKQLKRDHQPVSVHVELALYSLIHYVIASPSPLSLLHDNPLLCEHFIGAIPHFKEFVADEGERLTRYQARYPNAIHTLLKKEARTDWVCRKCRCHLTNFLIRYNNTSKNEASCFECWEEESEVDTPNSNNISNNASNKKDEKKRKEKKKEPKGKRNNQKGEAAFRFGHVDMLVSLANKASKLVQKL